MGLPSTYKQSEIKKTGRLLKGLMPLAVILIVILQGCTPNNPYRSEDDKKSIYYTTFNEPPKHLDPAKSYTDDEYGFIGEIYEPPLQYHFLARPYKIIPLTAEGVPQPVYMDKSGKKLFYDAPPEKVARAVYELRIKKGIKYQEHPAFAKDATGLPLYANIDAGTLSAIDGIRDFPKTGTRELSSDDYIFEIKRMADPQIGCPIYPMLEKYILGYHDYAELLKKDLAGIRAQRKKALGASYNQMLDEKNNPIVLDYNAHALPGVEKINEHTYRIILNAKYPQFIFWLAMPFFAPVPQEAARFYGQPLLAGKNITLDRYPVGTGAYMMDTFNPNMEIILARNANFHGERYPDYGEGDDEKKGLLTDAGKEVPFIDRIVFKLEKETIPRWNKFLQGYYDSSGISSESFDQAVSIGSGGGADVTDAMKARGIRLLTSVRPATYYAGFNMLDETVGGYSAEKQKLRQAVSIALDYEEYIEIFNNGRGIHAMSLIPPGIFGYGGAEEINPYVYAYDNGKKKAERLSIEYARRLLAEAGYPEGRDKTGRPLTITFDNPMTGADSTPVVNWYIKKFKTLGIQLENRTTDYNRFQEKMQKGNFQFFTWGWNADYPDPENFLFLLAGANGKVKFQGENASNYSNPEFDRLFKQMENMDSTPERAKIIRKLTEISQKDAAIVFGYHPVTFGLFHKWVENQKPHSMSFNTMKYLKLSPEERYKLRRAWNRPVVWPVAAVIVIIGALIAIGMTVIRKKAAKRH